jgi:hypothetical protein
MPIQHFAAPAGIKAPPLSFATRVGDLLFVSGIPGFDENGDLPDSFEAQFANVVTNIRRVLTEAGATLHDPHHLHGAGAAESQDADRDRGRGGVEGVGRRSLLGLTWQLSCEAQLRCLMDARGKLAHDDSPHAASCFASRASAIFMQRLRQNNPTGKSPKVCPALSRKIFPLTPRANQCSSSACLTR